MNGTAGMRALGGVLLCALALGSAIGVAAQVPAPPPAAAHELLAQVRQRVYNAPVVRGGFEQLKSVKGFKQPLRSSGDFIVARGKGIVWHVQQPFESVLVVKPDSLQSRGSDGKVTMQMRAQDEPVLRTVNAMLFAVMPANLAELAQHFEVTGQVNSKSWTLHLVPRDPTLAQWLSAVDLQGNQFVQEVKLQEVRGDASMIRILSPGAESALRPQDAAQFE